MTITTTPLAEIHLFSQRDRSYIEEVEMLRPFYHYPVELASFDQILLDNKARDVNRTLLVDTLKEQYANLEVSDSTKQNIDLLSKDNTYTITTAHQPSFMTGPSYYFYKILSAIRLAQELKTKHTDINFVPVFIVGGEDHDFEEVNHLEIFGKKISWESNQKGSVGKFQLDDQFHEALGQVKSVLGTSESAVAFSTAINKIAKTSTSYGQFAQGLTDHLFKSMGLVVLDMSAPALKKSFIPIIKKEIFEQISIKSVESTQQRLNDLGWKAQAMARQINFFYTGTGDRLRIEQSNDGYTVVGGTTQWTRASLEAEIDQYPERFSPNVVMRPLYQEFCLPNLAYIGGGGEIAYWLERKDQFKAFGLPFPMLVRRNSGMYIDGGSAKKMGKLNLSLTALMARTDDVISDYLKSKSGDALEFTNEIAEISKQFESLAAKAATVDPGLKKKILAEGTKMTKQVEQLTSRVARAAKSNEETAVNQIRKIREKLFPHDGLQERKSSFLEFYIKYGDSGLHELLPSFNPLDKTMVVIQD